MKRILLVAKNEFSTNISRKSFLFTTFGIPIIGILIMVAVNGLNSQSPDLLSNLIGSSPTSEFQVEGYVDEIGLINELPETIPPGALVEYDTRAAAEDATQAGEISGFYVLNEDLLDTAEIIFVSTEASPINSNMQSYFMVNAVRYNLLDNDLQLMTLVDQIYFNTKPQVVKTGADPDHEPLAFVVPYASIMIFYFVILMSSSLLLQSVTKEKQNRVIEILMSTISPLEMLAGKLLGLGVLGLIQTGFWIGSILTYLQFSGDTLEMLSAFNISPAFMAYALVFFLGGYGIYASLMAGLGALVPNMREASQSTIVVIFPLIIPMFFISLIIEDPHGMFSTIMSLVPFTAPIVMPSRIAIGGVAWWQILLAIVLLFGTAYLIVFLVARMFRAQTLLSGETFSTKRFFRALAGRI